MLFSRWTWRCRSRSRCGEPVVERPEGVAGAGGRREVPGQRAHAPERLAGLVVLGLQGRGPARRRPAMRPPGPRALQRFDRREEDGLLLRHVLFERRAEAAEEAGELRDDLRVGAAVDFEHPGGHAAEPRQLLAQRDVKPFDDVAAECRQGGVGKGGVGLVRPRGQLHLELREQLVGGQADRPAGVGERLLAAAAEVDSGAIEDAAGARKPGDDLADRGGQIE